MIYLDNGATTYPKPSKVINSMTKAMTKYGANAGRGAYKMAVDTTEQIFNCRKTLADFFSVDECENIIFTYNCTSALNMAIKGIAHKGSHFVVSDLEHNAVVRPLEKLKNDGICEYTKVIIERDEYKTFLNFQNAIKKNTAAVICTAASNVFGIIPPLKAIGELCLKHGIKFIVDSAQAAGVVPLSVSENNIDILCCAGHKGLYGPSGVGAMIINDYIKLNTIIEGGTGSNSASGLQPNILPDRFESGTPNVPGIIGLRYGVEFVKSIGPEKIRNHETNLVKYLQKNIEGMTKVLLYTDFYDEKQNLAPILSFNVNGLHSEETADYLSRNGIAVRAGMHCAPFAHRKMGTEEIGTVRICPSVFTKKEDIDFLIKCIRKIAN